jgi:hypothetical protein
MKEVGVFAPAPIATFDDECALVAAAAVPIFNAGEETPANLQLLFGHAAAK